MSRASAGMTSPTASGHSVSMMLTVISRTSTTAAMAPAHHCRWKTSLTEPRLDCVIMIANRISTLMAPMYTSTWVTARNGLPSRA